MSSHWFFEGEKKTNTTIRKFQIQTNRLPDSPPITDISGNGSSASPSSNSDPPYSPDNYGNYSGTFFFLYICILPGFSNCVNHPNYLRSHFIIPYSIALPPSVLCWLLQFCEFFRLFVGQGQVACSLFPPCPFPATRIHRRPLCRFSIRPLLFRLLTLFSYCQQPLSSSSSSFSPSNLGWGLSTSCSPHCL